MYMIDFQSGRKGMIFFEMFNLYSDNLLQKAQPLGNVATFSKPLAKSELNSAAEKPLTIDPFCTADA